jgi:hypothetical protein
MIITQRELWLTFASCWPRQRLAVGATIVALSMPVHGGPARAADTSAPTRLEVRATPPNPLEVRGDSGRVTFGIEGGAQFVGEKAAFWNLSKTYPGPTPFNPTLAWWEGYFAPSMRFDVAVARYVELYGSLSIVGSGTANTDVFGAGNSGRVLPERAFAGVRIGGGDWPVWLDISGGSQPYQIGSGMLIQAGASNGFERGALVFSPRVAWANTAIVRAEAGPVKAEAFYLSPNDLASNPTNTRMAGTHVSVALGGDQSVGIAYGRVLTSDVPSVQAAAGPLGSPLVIPNGREGLQFVHAYSRVNPLAAWTDGFWLAGDLALERNDGIDLRAWAGRLEVGQRLANWPGQPALSYAIATFSGDNPATLRNERFDPLYFNGSPGAWASGGNASLIFINSNLNMHRVTLSLTPSPQDIVSLRYWRIFANELSSPLQFGQATRFAAAGSSPGLISGVTHAHLSDGTLAEYTRVVNANTFVTVGVALSRPGEGIRALQNGAGPLWLGGFANIVVKY